MASPQPNPAIPDSFTAQERFLVEKTEEAVRDGLQLEAWMREQHRALNAIPLALKRAYNLPNQSFGYFGSLNLNGKTTSLMGARQEIDFGKITGPDPGQRLKDFVLGEFLKRANWTYPDGNPGGFSIEQTLYRNMQGVYGKLPDNMRNGCIDWRQLGTEYEWVLLTVQIHDFVMNFGPITKRFKEAACVAPHRSFVHITEKPAEGYALEVAIGYPFVGFAPIPNVFGFGPGKFGIACKLYSFMLSDKNEVKVTMNFAAAPRCQKVFDFGKHIPDPIYGGAGMLQRLTLGLLKVDGFHNRLDSQMLAQHCRVHQSLMEGVSKVWNDWLGGGKA